MSSEPLIRPCREGDYAEVAAIYNIWIRRGGATMDTFEKTPGDIERWVGSMDDREILLVIKEPAEGGGGIGGWGVVKRYSDRLGYRVCCETSVFLHPDRLRSGYGTAMKRALLERCRAFGYHHLIARIWADNTASIEYNKRLGYEVVGTQREIGHCHGEWRDICVMQLVLDDVPAWRPELGLPVAPASGAARGPEASEPAIEGAGDAAPSAEPPDPGAARRRHGEVYLIVAPPRTASTALARVLWQHPSVGWYCHEPFDAVHHRGAGLAAAAAALERPLRVNGRADGDGAGALVVKEMTFQAGGHFPWLASITRRPVIFLLRDPRLAIASRMRQRERGGQPALFPAAESGWLDLQAQVAACRVRGIPYRLLDSTAMRDRPRRVLGPLFEALGLEFSADYLAWEPAGGLELGALGGEQAHWYHRVLESRGLEPAGDEAPPPIGDFPEALRDHVGLCLDIYRRLLDEAAAG